MSMCISTAQACIKCAAKFCLCRRCCFTSAPCSFFAFFELCPFRVAGVALAGHFQISHVVWHDRCSFCTLLKHWQAWVKIESHVSWQAHLERGTCWSFSVAGALLCRRRPKVVGTQAKRHFLHFQCSFFVMHACFMKIKYVLVQPSLSLWRSANLDIARATLLALCGCRFALAVARCKNYPAMLNYAELSWFS